LRISAKIAVGTSPQVQKVGFDVSVPSSLTILEHQCQSFDKAINYTNYKDQPCFKNEFTFDPSASKTVKKTGLLCDDRCMHGPEIGEIMYDKFGVSGSKNTVNIYFF
jgi:hypothetical protein